MITRPHFVLRISPALRSLGVGGYIVLSLMLCSIAPISYAFEVPINDGFVTDDINLLSAEQELSLEQNLSEYRNETTNEIAIAIVKSLDGESIVDAAVDIGREWSVGSQEHDNGIVFLVSYEDRAVFLATGYGLEGAVPDIVAKGIIDNDVTPAFRSGEYYRGIAAAVESLKKHIDGEYTAERYTEKKSSGTSGGFVLLLVFVLFEWIVAILARTRSWWLGGLIGGIAGCILAAVQGWWLSIPILTIFGLVLDYVVSKNYRRRGKTSWWAGGGWGPGGGGRGGFGGFSGGSFGGGGGGGSW